MMLLALFSGQRDQTIHNLTVGYISLYQDKVFSRVLKHLKAWDSQKPLELQVFQNRNAMYTHYSSA